MGQQASARAGRASESAASRVDESALAMNDPNEVWPQIRAKQAFQPVSTSENLERRPDSIRFVVVSDTHGQHRKVDVPHGDVLLHAGDFTNVGEPEQVQDFHDWVAEQSHPIKIVIAGNHDLTMDAPFYKRGVGAVRLCSKRTHDPEKVRTILTASRQVVYLEDAMFEIPIATLTGNASHSARNIKVWGSPYQPEFGEWAFNLPRGSATKAKACEVPTETDVLLTHGPPLGRGDLCSSGARAGCIDLLYEVQTRVKPAVHIFGHIHEGYGASCDGHTTYVNASSCTLAYKPVQPPIVFDVDIFPDGGIGAPVFIGAVPLSPVDDQRSSKTRRLAPGD